jgi:hypothetical protein
MDKKNKLTITDLLSVKHALSNFTAFDNKIKKEKQKKTTNMETIFDKKNVRKLKKKT